MRKIAPFICILALIVILGSAIFVFANGHQLGSPGFQGYVMWTGIMTIVWFVFAPFWLISDDSD